MDRDSFIALLVSWGLTTSSAQIFEDHGFDEGILKSSTLEELQPILLQLPLGHRLAIKRHIITPSASCSGLATSGKKIRDAPASPEALRGTPKVRSEPHPAPSSSRGAEMISPRRSPRKNGDKVNDETNVARNLFGESHSPTPSCSKEREGEELKIIEETIDKAEETALRRSPRKSPKETADEEKLITSHKSLESKLLKTSDGAAVLKKYKTSKNLTDRDRCHIAQIIMRNEFDESSRKEVPNGHLAQLAKYIVRLFPSEDEEEWFVPFSKEGKIKKRASGRLLDLRDNIRKNLIKAGTASSKRPSRQKGKPAALVPPQLPEETKNKITFIKKAKKISPTVLVYWKETVVERLDDIRKKDLKIHEIFELYPVLGLDEGWQLVNIDYEVRFPKHVHSLEVNWGDFQENLLEFMKLKCETEKHTQESISKANISLTELDDEKSTIHAARLLAFLLNRASTVVGASGSMKLDKFDVMDGFMCVTSNVADTLEKKKTKFASIGLNMQIFPIIEFNKDQNKLKSRVFVNNVLYPAESPLNALDLAFKIFQVMDAEYPKESKVAWVYLQKNLYNLKTANDPSFADERKLLRDLLEFKLKQQYVSTS